MYLKKWKLAAGIIFCGMLTAVIPHGADRAEAAVGVETSSFYKIKIDAPAVTVYSERNIFSEKEATVYRSQIYDVEEVADGWVKLADDSAAGYIRIFDGAILVEATQEKVNPEALLRDEIVEYALQFVGGRYVWGGTDPHKGADCSGFTAYVMRHVAGVSLSHSSRAQAGEGRRVKTPQPGDLIFYSEDGSINHVAIYIGNGQIVHASSEKTGIKVSRWNYRTPVKIVDVLP